MSPKKPPNVMAFVMVAFADKSRHQNTSTKTVF
jgi:hypothetical protein